MDALGSPKILTTFAEQCDKALRLNIRVFFKGFLY